MKSIFKEIILACIFMAWLYPTTAEAIWGPSPPNRVGVLMIEMEKMQTQSPCFARLTRSPDQPLVKTESPQPDKSTSSALARRPKVPSPSGYLGSWEELNKFIEDNELRFWVEEARITQILRQKKNENGVSRNAPDHFVRLISDYRDSVKDILLQKNLKEGQILKVLYYNISSVSSGLIPVEWSRSSSELNYFLTDQLELLRYLLAEEIVHNYETLGGRIRKIVNRHLFGLFPSATKKYYSITKPLKKYLGEISP